MIDLSTDVEAPPAAAVPSEPMRRRAVRAERTRRPSMVLALLVTILSGWLYAQSFPGANVWILAFVGVGGMLVALRGRSFWGGVLVGFVGGLAFWLTLVAWTALYLGPLPWAALSVLESLYLAVAGGLIATAYRAIPLVWSGRAGRVLLAPLVVAAVWTARESAADTWPYGGFGWGRMSLSQSTSPFAPLVAWLGLSGLTFVLVFLVAFAVACFVEPVSGIRSADVCPDRFGTFLPRLAAVVAVTIGVLAVPPVPLSVTGATRIAGIQANSRSGYFDHLDYAGQVLDENVAASLSPKVVGQGVDLVVWPENASDVDPLRDPSAAARWNDVSVLTGSPILGGTITERDGDYYNSSLLWQANTGVTGVYDKVHPVPFGEYVPDRTFWRQFAPSLIDLIQRDFTPGTRSSVLDIGDLAVGVNICFDIVDDGLILGSVADGAQVLVAQTNNADFGHTDESVQQLAIARMRAIETGRSIVTVSTVASTAAIGPDGRTIAAIPSFRTGQLVATVPTADGITPAVAFGIPLGELIAWFGLSAPPCAAFLARRRR